MTVRQAPMPSFPWSRPSAFLLTLLALVLVFPAAPAHAQTFNAQRYYERCLEFERGGDLETARHSCLNAITADPSHSRARLALARVELELGNIGSAQHELQQVAERITTPEPHLLLGRLHVLSENYGAAEASLREAQRRGADAQDSAWRGELAYLWGHLEQNRGQFQKAVLHYRESVRLAPGDLDQRLALARLLFDMGEVSEARGLLEGYVAEYGDPARPQVNSLLGWTLWAQGELQPAAQQLERAMALRGAGYGSEQANDLRALGLIYFGMGDLQAGGLAWREAAQRGNLFETFLAGNLLWLLLLLLLVGAHLVGESRVGGQNLENETHAEAWSVGQVYRVAAMGLLLGLPLAMIYGAVRYDNLLSLFTPIQSSDSRAILFIVFSVVVALGSWRAVRRSGRVPRAMLLGNNDRAGSGILLGVLLLVATFAYRAYLPDWEWLGNYYLDLAHLTPAAALALALIPLSEIFFRPFAFPAYEARYGSHMAVLLSGSLSALIFATPAPLLLASGLLLAGTFRGNRSGSFVLAAQFTLNLGLLAAVTLMPLLRSLFVG